MDAAQESYSQRLRDGSVEYVGHRIKQVRAGTEGRRVFLVNGINTAPHEAAEMARVLAACLRHPLYLVYSQTEGRLKDIVECLGLKVDLFGRFTSLSDLIGERVAAAAGAAPRTLSARAVAVADNVAAALFQSLYVELAAHREVWVYAHSEGALFARLVIDSLAAIGEASEQQLRIVGLDWMAGFSLSELRRLHVRTFGAAAASWPQRLDVRHFHVSGDLVSGIVGPRASLVEEDRTLVKHPAALTPMKLADVRHAPIALAAYFVGSCLDRPDWRDDAIRYFVDGAANLRIDYHWTQRSHEFIRAYLLTFWHEIESDFALT